MKKSTSLIKVKMQTIFSLQTLTRVIIGGLLIALTNAPNIALALIVQEASSIQPNQVSQITDVTKALEPKPKKADSQRLSTDGQLVLFLLGFGSVVVAIAIIRNRYHSSQKTQHNLNKQSRDVKSADFHHTTKPRSIPTQRVTESTINIFEVEEIANWSSSYYSQDRNDNSNSNCGSGIDSSSDRENTHDGGSSHDSNSHDSSSSDCGSSYDSSSSDSGSSYDSSSW